MKCVEVLDSKGWQLFHSVPFLIYANDKQWISHLQGDVQDVFNPQKNPIASHGESRIFVLLDNQEKPIGRIAAFIDHEANSHLEYPIGGIGFFECIENNEAANLLFETAENWLREKGMQAVDGPVNFGGRDKYWGLLVKGFYPPLFQENYNPSYYASFFEANEYIAWEQILTIKGDLNDLDVSRLRAVCSRIRQSNEVVVELYDPKKKDKYAEDFCEIFNAAFGRFEHFKPAEPEKIKAILEESKLILDPLLLAICYINGQPAAFCATFPDINPLLKSARGKLSWWKIPGLIFRLKTAKKLFIKGTGFAIHPDFKTKGAFALIIEFMASPALSQKYQYYFLTTVRAHNREAVSLYFKAGKMQVDRVHIGYRKALQPNVEVVPNEFMEV